MRFVSENCSELPTSYPEQRVSRTSCAIETWEIGNGFASDTQADNTACLCVLLLFRWKWWSYGLYLILNKGCIEQLVNTNGEV